MRFNRQVFVKVCVLETEIRNLLRQAIQLWFYDAKPETRPSESTNNTSDRHPDENVWRRRETVRLNEAACGTTLSIVENFSLSRAITIAQRASSTESTPKPIITILVIRARLCVRRTQDTNVQSTAAKSKTPTSKYTNDMDVRDTVLAIRIWKSFCRDVGFELMTLAAKVLSTADTRGWDSYLYVWWLLYLRVVKQRIRVQSRAYINLQVIIILWTEMTRNKAVKICASFGRWGKRDPCPDKCPKGPAGSWSFNACGRSKDSTQSATRNVSRQHRWSDLLA